MLRKSLSFLLLVFISFNLFACKEKDADLVATFYPHYDILNNIAKDKLKVSLIAPFGGEVHDYTPTPKDIVMINESKLFVYASNELDTWVNELVNTDINIINMSNRVDVEFSDDLSAVIHYWTDPFVFLKMIDVLKAEIIKIDPTNIDFYTNNANLYKARIENIHLELVDFLETDAAIKELYFAGHNALGGFSYRYDLTINYLINHFSPETEHTIKQIEGLVKDLKETQTKYLFIEELVEPYVANTIKRELKKENLKITLLELHGFHNITKEQAKRGVSYADLFQQNVINIKQALNSI